MHIVMKCNGSDVFIKKEGEEEGAEVADIVYGLVVPALVGLGFTKEDIDVGFADYLAETGFCDDCMDDMCDDCKQDYEADPHDDGFDEGCDEDCCECGPFYSLKLED